MRSFGVPIQLVSRVRWSYEPWRTARFILPGRPLYNALPTLQIHQQQCIHWLYVGDTKFDDEADLCLPARKGPLKLDATAASRIAHGGGCRNPHNPALPSSLQTFGSSLKAALKKDARAPKTGIGEHDRIAECTLKLAYSSNRRL